LSYDLNIVEQFILTQFKCPDYKSRLMLMIGKYTRSMSNYYTTFILSKDLTDLVLI